MENINKILEKRRLSYYLGVNLRAGEELLGRRAVPGGFENFWSDEQTRKKFTQPQMPGIDLRYKIKPFIGELRYKDVEKSLLAILVRNVMPGESALMFCYISQKKDDFGRKNSCDIIIFLQNQDAEEIIKIAQSNSVQVMNGIMDKIDTQLYIIAPYGDLSEFHYGVLELRINESWLDLSNKQLNVKK